jgi:undecaprenyl-phosphate 4-deoxy-4-formamido-L-arabinose transferase
MLGVEQAARPALSIVIPVYNSENTIIPLVEALSALRPDGGLEIVLVNDGSSDASHDLCVEVSQRAQVPVTYIEHMRNFGEHNAILTGLRHVNGDYVITMDDDLQNPPEEVIRLFDYARRSGLDIVYTRYAVKAHAGWRNLGSKFSNWMADRLLDKPAGLYLSSFRCLSRAVVQAIAEHRGPYPYIDGLLLQVSHRTGAFDVQHLPRVHGQSNYNLRRLVRLWLNLATSFSVLPLRLATVAGTIMAVLGAVGAIGIIAESVFVGTPPGFASIIVAIALIGGVQCLMLGIIGEYVGRAFLAAAGKPQSVVRTIIKTSPAGIDAEGANHGACVSL